MGGYSAGEDSLPAVASFNGDALFVSNSAAANGGNNSSQGGRIEVNSCKIHALR